jgi:hypothetical protein
MPQDIDYVYGLGYILWRWSWLFALLWAAYVIGSM